MKKNNLKLIVTVAFFSAILVTGCTKDEVEPTVAVTQANLDAASNFIKSATGGFAHGGPAGISPDSTIREIFSDLSGVNGNIPIGSIVTKKTFKKGADGNKTNTLFVTFAMVKREAGYDPANQDWEYIMMPYDNSVDYGAHPFGILPVEGEMRGKLNSCIGCHASAGGGDYLFAND